MLKQRLQACCTKLKRYDDRVKGYHQNRLFHGNQKKLYSELKGEDNDQEIPNPEESIEFWNNIWSIEVEHNKEAEWVKNMKKKTDISTEVKNLESQLPC